MGTRDLSHATVARVKAAFAPQDWPGALGQLSAWTRAHGPHTTLPDRILIAAIATSEGSLAGLADALRLASTDWRDLLVAAEFAHDTHAHERWWPPGYDELIGLAHKLTTRLHLDVMERRSLPGGRMPLSAIVEAVRRELAEHGWFPRENRGPHLDGPGAVLTSRASAFVCYERHEIGVSRHADVRARAMATLEEAVRGYLSVVAPHGVIDGIAVDGCGEPT